MIKYNIFNEYKLLYKLATRLYEFLDC